jgi:tetratricopeptide (TPR) repeat protein
MRSWRTCLVVTVLLGIAFSAGWVMARGGAAKSEPSLYLGKEPKAAAEALLAVAASQAGAGSWENIGVGRVYYLSGDKEKGEALFKKAIEKKAEKSDWRRIARVYAEAGEFEKAVSAMESAIALAPQAEGYQGELGAMLNLKGDRAKAEEWFAKSFAKDPNDIWATVNAAGSYIGVTPQ